MLLLVVATSLASIAHAASELQLKAETQEVGSWAEPLAGLVVVLAGAITSIVLLALCAGKKEQPKHQLQSVAIQVSHASLCRFFGSTYGDGLCSVTNSNQFQLATT
jgi:hypothetical protein